MDEGGVISLGHPAGMDKAMPAPLELEFIIFALLQICRADGAGGGVIPLSFVRKIDAHHLRGLVSNAGRRAASPRYSRLSAGCQPALQP
jgi:hypothetical protein